MQAGYYLLAVLMGAIAAIYLPLNARFADQAGSLSFAVFVFFGVAAVTAGSVFLVKGTHFSALKLGAVDPPLFVLGVVSCSVILLGTFVIPKVGPGAFFVCMIAGEVAIGLTMSHYGFISPQQFPITPLKIVGAIAVVGGVMLIRWEESSQVQASMAPDQPIVVAERGVDAED